MGTDYPFSWTKTAVDHILATPGLSDGERVAILDGRRARCRDPAFASASSIQTGA
jgi:aminocarboxymuconate-semialdehyde decarboxylase